MKKLSKSILAKCEKCARENSIETYNKIYIMPVGYKGNFSYYTVCKCCGSVIYLRKEEVPKEVERRFRFSLLFI